MGGTVSVWPKPEVSRAVPGVARSVVLSQQGWAMVIVVPLMEATGQRDSVQLEGPLG